jgi:general secretion pathway protein G
VTRSKIQAGFSLLELLVAMMIIAVLGTLGFKFVRGHAAQARYLKAQDDIRIVSQGLDQYYLRFGKYPDFGSYEAMVEPNSPLVKGNLIKTNMSPTDPFGQPFEGKSGKGNYELKCGGDPDAQEERGPIVSTPGNMTASGPGQSAPAAGAAKGGEAKPEGPAK